MPGFSPMSATISLPPAQPQAQSDSRTQPTRQLLQPELKGQFLATLFAYSSTIGQTDADPFTTATGARVTDGIVANNCLPFGTKVRFPMVFGDKEFVVADRMAVRHGCYSFDIWQATTAEAKQFGRQFSVVEVY